MNHLAFKCDLDLQPTLKMFNMTLRTSCQGEQLCQIIFKSMFKHVSYSPDKLNVWPFHNLIFNCDLDIHISEHVSNGTSTLQGQQLSQIILKSMHQCTSYDRLIWTDTHTPNIHRTEAVTTMSQLPQAGLTKMVQKSIKLFLSIHELTASCCVSIKSSLDLIVIEF